MEECPKMMPSVHIFEWKVLSGESTLYHMWGCPSFVRTGHYEYKLSLKDSRQP